MRLIDADKIKLPQGFFEKVDNVPKFYEWLDKQPTVDEPVRHGRWLVDDGCSYCSVCRNNFKKAIMNHAKYCPMCGAKMDGERREDG